MSIKKAQDNSSYLSNINIGKGLISIKTENNKEFIETNLGAGLKYDNNKIIVDPDAQLNITFSTALSTQNYRYYDDETETLTVDYTKIQLNGGTVYYNNLQKIVIESYPQNQHMLIPVLQTLDEPGEYELPAIGTRYIYYSLSDQDIVIITTNALDSNNNYIPVSTITTGYDDTSEKYITLAIYDNRPSISWNTYASPDYLPSSKVGEIVRFKADYDPGPNFIKADGRTIPDAYPSLQKIYGSTVPTIPSANGTDFYVRARLESGFVISPDSYWSTELYHLANLDLMIEAYYYTTTDVKLSDNELNDLYTNGFPIINKASSSVTQPYKYILTFPQAINNGQLSVHNAETHDIKWNVDGDKVYIVASDAQTSIGEFDFYGSMSNVAMALNKWDTYATEDLTPEPDTTVLSIPFLLYNKNVDVYKNGQLLKSSEWSVASNNSIQLVTPANGTDWFRVVSTAKLPTHAHQHMPNYESEWVAIVPGSSVTITHNLNLTDPLKASYNILRKTNTGDIYTNYSTLNCQNHQANSVDVYVTPADSSISYIKLIIIANQYNNNALPWYGESGSTIDLEEKALITEANITAKQLISSTTNTSPIDVQSTVKVTNLNSDLLDGLHAASDNIVLTVVSRDASGNFSAGIITASLSGNAATATKLATARTINGISFDGSDNITITANVPNALTIGTGLSGTSSTFNGSSAVTVSLLDIAAGSTNVGALKYNGTTVSNGTFNGSSTAPTNTTRLNYEGYFYATKVYNAVWGDIVDFVEFNNNIKIEYGKVYTRNECGEVVLTSKYGQSALGIASDTFGIGVGDKSIPNQIPIAVCGFVLAYVDKQYKFGTPLTPAKNGILTKAKWYTKKHRIIAIYDRPENNNEWNKIKVNRRNWIRII